MEIETALLISGGVSASPEHPRTVNVGIRLLFQTWNGTISLCKPPLMFHGKGAVFIQLTPMQCHTDVKKVFQLTLRLAQ